MMAIPWWVFLVLGSVLMFGGLAAILAGRKHKLMFKLALSLYVTGVLFVGFSAWKSDKEDAQVRADRENRTTTVTDVVLEAHQVPIKESGGKCVQSFTLNHGSYPLEMNCAAFVVDFDAPNVVHQFPKAGDVLRVKFVRPKDSMGKPEVREVYNLTQETERARSAPPPILEAPLAK